MKKILVLAALVSTLAGVQSMGFAATHHAMKAKVRVVASQANTTVHHHGNVKCPSTPKCNCD